MAAFKYYWEDFPVGRVREVGPVTVSREDIISFARQFDPQPFHVDEEAGRRSMFEGLIASGWHTCSLAMRMICDAYLLDTASAGSPGVDNVRWLQPVRPGDILRLRIEVIEARPLQSRPELGLVRNRWELSNQRGETVLRMEGSGMIRRRETG